MSRNTTQLAAPPGAGTISDSGNDPSEKAHRDSCPTTVLLDLPDELLLRILSHLSADDALHLPKSVSRTCSRLYRLCRDPSPWVDVGAAVGDLNALKELPKSRAEWSAWVNRDLRLLGSCLRDETRSLRLRHLSTVNEIKEEKEAESGTKTFGFCCDWLQEQKVLEKCPNLEMLRLSGAVRFFLPRGARCLGTLRHLAWDTPFFMESVWANLDHQLPELRTVETTKFRTDYEKEKFTEEESLQMEEVFCGWASVRHAVLDMDNRSPVAEKLVLRGFRYEEMKTMKRHGFFPEEEALRCKRARLASKVVVVTETGKRWRMLVPEEAEEDCGCCGPELKKHPGR